MSQPSILEVFALIRRYAEAFAAAGIELKDVKNLTDEQLAELDTEAYNALQRAQAEAEARVAEVKDE